MYGSMLEVEHELYMELDVPDVDYKRPFYYDVLEGKTFPFTTEESRLRNQTNLLMTFLKMEDSVRLWRTTGSRLALRLASLLHWLILIVV